MTLASGVNPWTEVPREPPYVLPSDKPFIDVFNAALVPDHVLRVRGDLIPEPFFGPFNAPVVVLLLNPGVASGDTNAHRDGRLREMLLHNLIREKTELPHVHLCRESTHPGALWWKRGVRGLLHLPLDRLAKRLLAVEYFPYHSVAFGHSSLRLPSQDFSFVLVRKAIERHALIVVARGRKLWFGAVPALANYANLLSVASDRSFTLSPGNLTEKGFTQLSAVLGAE